MIVFLLALALTVPLAAAQAPKTVTLDVKDAEPRVVIKEMQKQCGIRNVMIDPDVPNTGATFYFRQVPCETAFRVVLRTYGLTTQVQVLR